MARWVSLVFGVLCVQLAAGATVLIGLNQTVSGSVSHSTTTCYELELDAADQKSAVWMGKPSLLLRLEPCLGFPHMLVSVYGCPSEGNPVVYEYMSTQQLRSIVATTRAGVSTTPPQQWEYIGDVETLSVELTHKKFFIEVEHFYSASASELPDRVNWPDPSTHSFQLTSRMFDANQTDPYQNATKSHHFPFGYVNSTTWDRKLVRGNSSSAPTGVGGGDPSVAVLFQEPPANTTYWAHGEQHTAWDRSQFEFTAFVMDITKNVGKSDGNFSSWLSQMCPPESEACSTDDCANCHTSYKDCPKEFLIDCSEKTLNVAKLKKNISSVMDEFLKVGRKNDGVMWNTWTTCGVMQNMQPIDDSVNIKNLAAYQMRDQADPSGPVWFRVGDKLKEATRSTATGKWLEFDIGGFKQSDNNVFVINVVFRHITDHSVVGVYEPFSLQLRTPRYETPELDSTDHAVLIGVGSGLVFCVLIFAIAAVCVAMRRKKQLKERILARGEEEDPKQRDLKQPQAKKVEEWNVHPPAPPKQVE